MSIIPPLLHIAVILLGGISLSSSNKSPRAVSATEVVPVGPVIVENYIIINPTWKNSI